MFLNIDFFALGARFLQLLGGSWASLGRLWASKMCPKSFPIIEGSLFFLTCLVFAAALSNSFDLGGFGDDFGKVLGRFGMVLERFGEDFG